MVYSSPFVIFVLFLRPCLARCHLHLVVRLMFLFSVQRTHLGLLDHSSSSALSFCLQERHILGLKISHKLLESSEDTYNLHPIPLGRSL